MLKKKRKKETGDVNFNNVSSLTQFISKMLFQPVTNVKIYEIFLHSFFFAFKISFINEVFKITYQSLFNFHIDEKMSGLYL